jgi:hypothetical protein
MAVDLGRVGKNPNALGGQGACPLMLPSPLGREGVTLAISTTSSKNPMEFTLKIKKFRYDEGIPLVFLWYDEHRRPRWDAPAADQ